MERRTWRHVEQALLRSRRKTSLRLADVADMLLKQGVEWPTEADLYLAAKMLAAARRA